MDYWVRRARQSLQGNDSAASKGWSGAEWAGCGRTLSQSVLQSEEEPWKMHGPHTADKAWQNYTHKDTDIRQYVQYHRAIRVDLMSVRQVVTRRTPVRWWFAASLIYIPIWVSDIWFHKRNNMGCHLGSGNFWWNIWLFLDILQTKPFQKK